MQDLSLQSLPSSPGIYIFKDINNKILYVGKSKNLKNRVSSYFQKTAKLGPKTESMVKKIVKFETIEVDSEIEALLLEASLIKKFLPKYNIELKDGKSYPYIKITVKETFPRVLYSRQKTNDKSLYFGPFTDSSKVYFILKWLRKIFPYCSCKTHPKSCLYYHLNLCPHPTHEIDRKNYKKTINKIIDFLSGKKNHVIKKLEKEMAFYSKKLNFEEAEKIKKQIETIKFITAKRIAPDSYLENPNLLQDRVDEELKTLQKELKLDKKPNTIECYDISNISGKNAVGSLVTFENGIANKGKYKKFKIKSKNTPDDLAMLKEVLERRFKNKWPFPDLIVIDGGKGQLQVLLNIISKYNYKTKGISLAKRLEEIYIEENKFITNISLPLENPALKLLQKIRDEAHRFAKNYHIVLRKKSFFQKI